MGLAVQIGAIACTLYLNIRGLVETRGLYEDRYVDMGANAHHIQRDSGGLCPGCVG